jgi:lipoprotein signal peptidase
MPGRHRLGLIAAAIAAAIDQASKAWALDALWPPYSEGIALLPVLNLRLGFNTGVTFGMFAQSAAEAVWLLVAIKPAVVAWLLLWLRRAASRVEATAMGLIIGGALGNILDRMRIGAVTDFVDAHHGGWHWLTFNLADVAIVCGVTLLVLLSFRATAPQAFEPTAPGPDTPRPLPGERIIGRADAPVAVIEYHSLTCGNCANFHTMVFPRIRAAFIEPGWFAS